MDAVAVDQSQPSHLNNCQQPQHPSMHPLQHQQQQQVMPRASTTAVITAVISDVTQLEQQTLEQNSTLPQQQVMMDGVKHQQEANRQQQQPDPQQQPLRQQQQQLEQVAAQQLGNSTAQLTTDSHLAIQGDCRVPAVASTVNPALSVPAAAAAAAITKITDDDDGDTMQVDEGVALETRADSRGPGNSSSTRSKEDTDSKQAKPKPPPKPRPTHFVALRVSHCPQVLSCIERIQSQLLENCPELQPCLLEPITAHLTIMVLNLPGKDEELAAQAVLSELTEVLQQKGLGQLTIQLAGLSTFRNQVLYLNVLPGPARDQIEQLGSAVISHFQSAGSELVIEEPGRGFTPHVTVAKTSRLKGSRHHHHKRRKGRLKIPAESWSALADVDAGEVDIVELQICSMQGRKNGEFYKVTHSLQLPAVVPPAPAAVPAAPAPAATPAAAPAAAIAPTPGKKRAAQGPLAAAKQRFKLLLNAFVCGKRSAQHVDLKQDEPVA